MNVFKLIQSIETLMSSVTTDFEYMTLSKAIQLLKLGRIQTVANIAALPTNLTNSGNLYYVTSEEELYYNQGATWFTLYSFTRIPYGWGYNGYGRVGDGTPFTKSSPVTVVGGITNWSQLSAGSTHSLGLTTAGIIYAWGRNTNGQLGDSTTSTRSSPVTVVGSFTNWSQVSAGGDGAFGNQGFSLGLRSSGQVYAWGHNAYGQLGRSDTTSRSSPVLVVGGITSWSQVSASNGKHSLGLTSASIAYAWGSNVYNGQLGDNTTSNRSSPVTVVGGISNWRSIAGGQYNSIGLTATGIAYCWGKNQYGQLGDNTTSNRSSPVTVIGGITNWSQVDKGHTHNIGVTTSGIVYGWGRGYAGALGDNTTSNRSSPVTVVGGITNWSSVSGGGRHSLGLTSTGIIYAWGLNNTGELGDNTASSRLSPVTVVGGITNWSSISCGHLHNLALTSTLF